jgi:hypothetical protein
LKKEYQHMKECYPDEFARLYEKALNKTFPTSSEQPRRGTAEYIAVTQLETKYGIVK